MSISLNYLQQCSSETGFGIGPLEKVVRLGDIAADIARHPFLGKVLALKGGTALNLCFGRPQRLSVDLDFNYIGHIERGKMLADRPLVEDALVRIAKQKSYRIQRSADAFAGRKLYLIYRSATGRNERVEVDLNYLFRMPIDGTEMQKMWQPGELDHPAVRVISLQEILVGKMLAYLDRRAVRDVWDLANLPVEAGEITVSNRFRSWFIALSAILDHPLSKYTRKRIETYFTDRLIAEQLAPMLITEAPFQPKTLVEESWDAISHLMKLKEKEVEYIESIQHGVFHPELLFPHNPEEAERAAAHPAILWKLLNVRTHMKKRSHLP